MAADLSILIDLVGWPVAVLTGVVLPFAFGGMIALALVKWRLERGDAKGGVLSGALLGTLLTVALVALAGGLAIATLTQSYGGSTPVSPNALYAWIAIAGGSAFLGALIVGGTTRRSARKRRAKHSLGTHEAEIADAASGGATEAEPGAANEEPVEEEGSSTESAPEPVAAPSDVAVPAPAEVADAPPIPPAGE